MVKVVKRLRSLIAEMDPTKSYDLASAVSVLKKSATAKFDETIDIAVNLGVDARQTDQLIRGMVALPHGIGKVVRVAVFAKGDKAKEAESAGADIVGEADLIEQVKKGIIDFDRCIATPDLMAQVGALGKVLGPKGLMPNPKLGTVTTDVATAVKAAKSGQVEYKTEKGGIVHAGIGKVSFSAEAISENIKAFVSALQQVKPSTSKGTYLRKVSVSLTMGPSVKIDVASFPFGNQAKAA